MSVTTAAQRVFNFSAGPAALPLSVLEQMQSELLAFPGAGASIMEISHRSKAYDQVHNEAIANIRRLLNLPENYQVLFMQGGATLQFAMVAADFLKGGTADYIYAGSWAKKAIAEAKKYGTARTVWSGADDNFVRMPKDEELDLDPNAAYLHFTSNETIQGIETQTEPKSGQVPLVCDASSDFLSRPIDVAPYGLIYAGAQKNVGPSGVTIVIVRDDMLARVPEGLPMLMDYKQMADANSLLNTPPCLAIYIVNLVTKWLLDEVGGLEAMAQRNTEKATLIYDVIDTSDGYYRGHAHADSRSKMNVTFRLPTEELEQEFIAQAKARELDGLKGHRSVGGCRASIYNAMPRAGVEALCAFMREFQQQHG